MSDPADADIRWMQRALRLAKRGEGHVEPNPMVGCVLVRRGRIVGEGWHRRFGGPHAEVWALRQAGRAARGATAYVTLEPCHRFGKTPPCTRALISAGVARVVAAVRDPNPQIDGKGLRELRAAGVATALGVCAEEARELISPFWSLMVRRRPWVIAKWAQTLDGRMATSTGDSRWITGEAARREVHRLRGRVDAILIGIGTALADDPMLTCRDAPRRRVATRIVLDSRLRLPIASCLMRTIDVAPLLIYTASTTPARRVQRLRSLGADVVRVPRARSGLSLEHVLDDLGRRSMSRVLVEGGAAVLSTFFDHGLVDEAHVYVQPAWVGDPLAPGVKLSRPAQSISKAFKGRAVEWQRIGDDMCCRIRWR